MHNFECDPTCIILVIFSLKKVLLCRVLTVPDNVLERAEECMCIIQWDQRLINSGHLSLSSPCPPQFHSAPFYPTAQWQHTVAQDTHSFVKDLKDTNKPLPLCVCEAITRGRELFWQMSPARLSHTHSGQDSPPRIQRPGLCLQDYARKWRFWHQINKNVGCWMQGEIVELLNPAWHWGGLLLFLSHRALRRPWRFGWCWTCFAMGYHHITPNSVLTPDKNLWHF